MTTTTEKTKQGWQKLKLGDVCDLQQGLAINIKSKHLIVEKSNLALLRITDLINNKEVQYINKELIPAQFIADEDSLIYTRTGQVGLVFKGRKGVVHNNCFKIKPKKELDKNYLYYFLKQNDIYNLANQMAQKSAQPDLTHPAFKSIEIYFPNDIETQKKIAEVLGAYDDLIEVNQKKIKILEELAQSIYKEWFVKSTQNGIPEGWEETTLGQIAFLIKDKFIDQRDFHLPLVDMSRIQSDNISVIKFGKPEELSTSRIIFKKDDILFGSIRCYLHKVAITPFDGVTNTSIFVFRAKKGNLKSLLTCFLSSKETMVWANQHSGGTKMPVINWEVLISKKIIIPKDVILDNFHKIVWPKLELIQSLSIQNQNLQKTRDILIPQLVGGRISLK